MVLLLVGKKYGWGKKLLGNDVISAEVGVEVMRLEWSYGNEREGGRGNG